MRSHEFISESNINLLNKLEIDADSQGFSINIPVNKTLRTKYSQIDISEMGLYITFDPKESSGDFAVHFDPEDYNEEEQGYLYRDRVFEKEVQNFLISIGFPADIANSVEFSESGMQDDGRASFDAYDLVDFLRSSILDSMTHSNPNQVVAIIKKTPGVIVHMNNINAQVANAAKTEIIKYCLEQFKKDLAQNSMSVIDTLKDAGINWPEFAAMEKSARALGK